MLAVHNHTTTKLTFVIVTGSEEPPGQRYEDLNYREAKIPGVAPHVRYERVFVDVKVVVLAG